MQSDPCGHSVEEFGEDCAHKDLHEVFVRDFPAASGCISE